MRPRSRPAGFRASCSGNGRCCHGCAGFPTPSPSSPGSTSRMIPSQATCSASRRMKRSARRACATCCFRQRTATSICRALPSLPATPTPGPGSRGGSLTPSCRPGRTPCTTSSRRPTSGTASSATGARRRSVCSRGPHRDGRVSRAADGFPGRKGRHCERRIAGNRHFRIVQLANFSMVVVQKTSQVPAYPAPPRRARRTQHRAKRMTMKRLAGRLNLFQRTMLDWRDLHPYIAVHAVRVPQPLDRLAVMRAIDETLEHAGLTGLELDRDRGRYEWHGGASASKLEVVAAGDAWQSALARTFERHLNEPFAREGRIDPFRFFAIDAGDAFFLGIAYDHFIAGGDSIVVLLNAIVDRYAGKPTPAPFSRYPRTHWRLFAQHPLRFVRGLARLPAMASSCRRTIRPRYRAIDDGYNAFTFFTLDEAEYSGLRRAAKAWSVTLNDALIALLLLAQDAQSPRDRTKRRHELAVASIMNLRDAHGEDSRTTFGQFLSSFRVSHPVAPDTTLAEIARDVNAATTRVKRERLYLTTLAAIAVDRV